jgi:hypothetical protein
LLWTLKIDLFHRLLKVYKNKQTKNCNKVQHCHSYSTYLVAKQSDQTYQQELHKINNLLGAWVSYSSEAKRFASMWYRKLSLQYFYFEHQASTKWSVLPGIWNNINSLFSYICLILTYSYLIIKLLTFNINTSLILAFQVNIRSTPLSKCLNTTKDNTWWENYQPLHSDPSFSRNGWLSYQPQTILWHSNNCNINISHDYLRIKSLNHTTKTELPLHFWNSKYMYCHWLRAIRRVSGFITLCGKKGYNPEQH